MAFKGGNPIIDKEVLPSNGATPADALAAREGQIKGEGGFGNIPGMGKSLLDIGEAFGIQKSDVGRMILKGITSGKFEIPGMKTETGRRKKLEVAVDQIIKLAWTMFGIFMIFQVFIVVVGIVT